MKMRHTPCNLCGKKKEKSLFIKGGNHIVKCTNCGLVYINPQPTWKQIKLFYAEHYFDLESFDSLPKNTSGYRGYVRNRRIFDNYFVDKLNFIEQHVAKGKILDLGCSLGFFLDLARARGWKGFGVEISEYAVAYAKKKLGINVFLGTLGEAKFEKGFFDVVTLFQTIEHLPDPGAALKEIYKILKKGGLLVITTPNINSFYTKVLGRHSFQYAHKEHLYYFTKETLVGMITKARFRKVIVSKDRNWSLPLGDLIERTHHFYPEFDFLLKPLSRIMQTTFPAYPKVPIPFGDMLAIGFK